MFATARYAIGTPLSLVEVALGSPDINPKETLSSPDIIYPISPVYFTVIVPFLFLLLFFIFLFHVLNISVVISVRNSPRLQGCKHL